MKHNDSFTIIGGGIAGLTTAIALQRLGIQPTIFEAVPVLGTLGAGLLLAANAMQALDRLGLAEPVALQGRQLDAFAVLDQQGQVITHTDTSQINKRYGMHNVAIHRAQLHQMLLNQLPPNALQTGKRAVGLTQRADEVRVHFEDGTTHQTAYLVVADGIHSPLRGQLLGELAPRYAGYTCWRAVIDWPSTSLHQATETWGRQGRIGMVPLANDQLYWFACVNAPGQDPQMRQQTSADLAKRFASYHTPILDVLTHTPNQRLIWNDILDLKPLARYAFGRTLLIGDAAHATTPNMGQGACQAIEDAVVLADELTRHQLPQQAFVGFEARRLARTHYITNTSWRLGQLAQTTNPVLVALRNGLLRGLPKRLSDRPLETLFAVDF